MRVRSISAIFGGLTALVLAGGAAQALPAPKALDPGAATNPGLEQVHWRPYRHCHWRRGYRWCHGYRRYRPYYFRRYYSRPYYYRHYRHPYRHRYYYRRSWW